VTTVDRRHACCITERQDSIKEEAKLPSSITSESKLLMLLPCQALLRNVISISFWFATLACQPVKPTQENSYRVKERYGTAARMQEPTFRY
jgi:hypothetical protein